MSPAALKRALDPAYIGSPFAQPFQFFDGDASTPMELTGRSVVLFLDRQGLPDAHHEITGAIQTEGRVLFSVTDTSAWIKGDYSLEVRLDGASVVVGRIAVAKGAGANGSDIVGAAQPPTAPGVVVSGSGVVQVVSVAPSGATDPSAIILPPDLSAALGGAETLAEALLWLAQNGGTPSPILRDLIGNVVISSVATGALSVAAAGEVLLSGAISSVSSATGSLTVGAASSIALVGSAVSSSSLTGAMTVVMQIALAGTAAGSSSVAGSLTVTAPSATYLPSSPAPAAAYSMNKIVSGYSGPTCSACSASDAATPTSPLDVFAGSDGKPDFTAAVAAFGSTFHIWKLYDQSGNGRDAVNVSKVSPFFRPAITGYSPDANVGWYSETYGNLNIPASVAASKKAVSTFSVVAGPQQTPVSQSAIICIGTGNSATSLSLLSSATGLTRLSDGFTEARRSIDMAPTVVGFVSGAASFKVHRDESIETLAALASDPATAGGYLGKYNTATTYGSYAQWGYSHVVYASAISDADALAVKAALKAIFAVSTKTKAITYFGDSIQFGQGATFGRNKQFYLGPLLSSKPYQHDCGMPGYTTSQQLNLYPQATLNGMFDATAAKHIAVNNIGLNDITANVAGGTTASTLIANVTTMINRLKTAGFTVIQEKLTPRTANSADQNTALATYNQWLDDNAVSLGITVIDYGSLTLNRPDGTHPDSASYQLMAGVAAPVLNGALG